ncbi:MAG TPA: hypothetical protein VG960_08290 [Caulobacteraceae bacterium]|nr:hypothetical protein [Caulobacteraceae bacterium]
MKPRLVFAHGWALDRAVWDKVLAALGPEADGAAVVDAGYYGRPSAPLGRGRAPILGVGQSLGVLELLADPPAPLAGLVAIDGFARFARGPDFPDGQPRAVLKLMEAALKATPGALLSEFMAKVLPGGWSNVGEPDAEVLARGLERLKALDGRAAAARLPVWSLHARFDPIAPLAMADASFAGADVRVRQVREAADHLSPITAPGACANLIRAALKALDA